MHLKDALEESVRHEARLALDQASTGIKPDHATAWHKLALVLFVRGKYGEGIQWAERAHETRKTLLWGGHPDTVASLHVLALLHHNAGNHRFALSLMHEAWSIRSNSYLLGDHHPDTLSSLYALARVHMAMGEHKDALPLMSRSLEAREGALGKEHPDTLASLHSLARVHHHLGDKSKALELMKRALDARERTLGPEHPDTLASCYGLASTMQASTEALALMQRAFEGCASTHGHDHPHTLVYGTCLGQLLSDVGRNSEGLPMVQQALEVSRRVLRPRQKKCALL